MSETWQEAYSELTRFITERSDIKIEANSIRLPDTVRTEFYELFNKVRTAFMQENSLTLLSEATNLSQKYLKAEQDVIKLLKLKNISMMASLSRFLNDPVDELRRGLYDPLFDLLKGLIEAEVFEAKSVQIIEASFKPLYCLGYGKWLILTLVKLAEAKKSFSFVLKELTLYDAHKAGSAVKEDLPIPKESNNISFSHKMESAFIVPDVLIHSARINRYIALRSQIGSAIGTATEASKNREWSPIDFATVLEPELILVYSDDNPDDISLIADAYNICRPDLIIESRAQEGWFVREGLMKVKAYHNILKPTLGTYIVSKESVPELSPEEQAEGIHILTAGLDGAKLEPIIEALIQKD